MNGIYCWLQVTLQSPHPSAPLEEIKIHANVFMSPSTVRTLISVNMNCQSTFGIRTGLRIEIESKAEIFFLSLGEKEEICFLSLGGKEGLVLKSI